MHGLKYLRLLQVVRRRKFRINLWVAVVGSEEGSSSDINGV